MGPRELEENPPARLGFGDGFRDEVAGIPNLAFPLGAMLVLDSEDAVRLCDAGKAVMLL